MQICINNLAASYRYFQVKSHFPLHCCVQNSLPGSFEIDKKPLGFGTKVPRKPLELLKVLITLGGESVSVENLSEALWPDSEGTVPMP